MSTALIKFSTVHYKFSELGLFHKAEKGTYLLEITLPPADWNNCKNLVNKIVGLVKVAKGSEPFIHIKIEDFENRQGDWRFDKACLDCLLQYLFHSQGIKIWKADAKSAPTSLVLKWHPDHPAIAEKWPRVMEKDRYTDFDLQFKDTPYGVHRSVLANKSVYFKNVFDAGKSQHALDEVISLEESVKTLRHYFYTGELEKCSIEVLNDLIHASHEYRLPHLRQFCREQACEMITPENLPRIVAALSHEKKKMYGVFAAHAFAKATLDDFDQVLQWIKGQTMEIDRPLFNKLIGHMLRHFKHEKMCPEKMQRVWDFCFDHCLYDSMAVCAHEIAWLNASTIDRPAAHRFDELYSYLSVIAGEHNQHIRGCVQFLSQGVSEAIKSYFEVLGTYLQRLPVDMIDLTRIDRLLEINKSLNISPFRRQVIESLNNVAKAHPEKVSQIKSIAVKYQFEGLLQQLNTLDTQSEVYGS
jgi:hypothetical protein